jgi:hypothetical protein
VEAYLSNLFNSILFRCQFLNQLRSRSSISLLATPRLFLKVSSPSALPQIRPSTKRESNPPSVNVIHQFNTPPPWWAKSSIQTWPDRTSQLSSKTRKWANSMNGTLSKLKRTWESSRYLNLMANKEKDIVPSPLTTSCTLTIKRMLVLQRERDLLQATLDLRSEAKDWKELRVKDQTMYGRPTTTCISMRSATLIHLLSHISRTKLQFLRILWFPTATPVKCTIITRSDQACNNSTGLHLIETSIKSRWANKNLELESLINT